MYAVKDKNYHIEEEEEEEEEEEISSEDHFIGDIHNEVCVRACVRVCVCGVCVCACVRA